MTAHGILAPAWGSGLDTSNGLEFVQQRIGLFAKIIALISLAFLIVGTFGGLAMQLTAPAEPPIQAVATNTVRTLIAHVTGLILPDFARGDAQRGARAAAKTQGRLGSPLLFHGHRARVGLASARRSAVALKSMSGNLGAHDPERTIDSW